MSTQDEIQRVGLAHLVAGLDDEERQLLRDAVAQYLDGQDGENSPAWRAFALGWCTATYAQREQRKVGTGSG